ncbi:MAG: DNA repair protein RecO [Dehalococcoidia bacterium]
MKTPHIYRTEAVVLRQRKLGEADKILTLYSPNLGKFDAVAKGVRRLKSRKAGHVELLSHTALLISHGRSLDIITQSEGIQPFPALRESLERISRAIYIAELVDRFTEERIENYPLYGLLLETLCRLSERDDLDLVSRYFELHLLAFTGYQPQLSVCTACRAPLAPVLNYFSPAAGGILCSACRLSETSPRALTVNALKVMRRLQSSSFTDASRLRLSTSLLSEIEEHLRIYIRFVLEREVRSLDYIQSVRHSLPAAESVVLAARVVS